MSAQEKSAQLKVHHEITLPPQEIVDLFKVTFDRELYDESGFDELQSQIQKVKSDLYNRDYIAAFDDDSKRTAYCCRWSPSRATAYASLFAHLQDCAQVIKCQDSDQNVLCIGGGAGGELVALASLFTPSREFVTKYSTAKQPCQEKHSLNVHLVDISNWSNVVNRLQDAISSKWLYADEHKFFNVQYSNRDILDMSADEIAISKLNLITLLFTTNELFSENKQKSIRLLQRFNQFCKTGCYLLIAESAGSYSHIMVGTKKFPIQFLIDTVLMGKRGQQEAGAWQLVSQSDSTWYRCDPRIDYPMKLENTRVFYRLYRKI